MLKCRWFFFFFFKKNETIWCSNSKSFKSMETSILSVFYFCNFQFCNLRHSNISFAMKSFCRLFFPPPIKAADYTVKLNGKISYKDSMIHVVNIHFAVCYLMNRVHSLLTEKEYSVFVLTGKLLTAPKFCIKFSVFIICI